MVTVRESPAGPGSPGGGSCRRRTSPLPCGLRSVHAHLWRVACLQSCQGRFRPAPHPRLPPPLMHDTPPPAMQPPIIPPTPSLRHGMFEDAQALFAGSLDKLAMPFVHAVPRWFRRARKLDPRRGGGAKPHPCRACCWPNAAWPCIWWTRRTGAAGCAPMRRRCARGRSVLRHFCNARQPPFRPRPWVSREIH